MRRLEKTVAAFALMLFLLAAPGLAMAQCELPAQPEAAATAAVTAQEGAVAAMTTGIIAGVETTTSIARAAMIAGMEVGWIALRERLAQYWKALLKAQKGQAAQQNAGQLDETRQLGSISDASTLAQAQRDVQKAELQLRRTIQPSEDGCRFDTAAPYIARAQGVSRAAASAASDSFIADATGRKGQPSAQGPAADFAARADQNSRLFCNPQGNGGNAGCTADGGEFADAHVLPSKTLFGRDTYDLSDARTLPALNELARNIVAYSPQPVRAESALRSASGREQRVGDREKLAQMDAAAAPIWNIMGERMPAGSAPEIEQMRIKIGVAQPSSTPSEYEIRKQAVEQLWDPNFYAGLQDSSPTTQQKQIYLRAYSVMQLYKLIDKMERISNIYAIQTSKLIDKYGTDGNGRGGEGGD